MDREKIFSKKRGLKQYKSYTDEDLYKSIDKELESDEIKKSFVGFKASELDDAIAKYNKYLEENSFESSAEKSSLISLVYLEILKERMQKFLLKEDEEKPDSIPLHMAEKIMELDTQVIDLKIKLGMLKEGEDESFLQTWEDLKKKALNYYNTHAGETYCRCPKCNGMFRLLMKVDNLEPAEATFFKDTTLYNKELLELYHNKILTLDQMAKIFGVHKKYIDFIYNNLFLIEKDKQIKGQ